MQQGCQVLDKYQFQYKKTYQRVELSCFYRLSRKVSSIDSLKTTCRKQKLPFSNKVSRQRVCMCVCVRVCVVVCRSCKSVKFVANNFAKRFLISFSLIITVNRSCCSCNNSKLWHINIEKENTGNQHRNRMLVTGLRTFLLSSWEKLHGKNWHVYNRLLTYHD